MSRAIYDRFAVSLEAIYSLIQSIPAARRNDCMILEDDYMIYYDKPHVMFKDLKNDKDAVRFADLPLIKKLEHVPKCIELLELAEKLNEGVIKDVQALTVLMEHELDKRLKMEEEQ